ncbi:MAG: DUF4956 domain-containing protein [Bacteroidota bacterium]|jgi:uncharacterized membrane protein YhiD involved in acid resistance|nr:DUF4956 domain-containing protein [Bacteroidota bacterium]
MRQEFQDIFAFSLSAREAAANLIIAFICGVFIALLYRVTYKGISYSGTFVNSIIMLSMITALVIMVIGNNLARAFGLVGAMSIIRFRTAVKDPQDIMFIFFALGIGLAAGVGIYAITITGTLLIGLAFFITTKYNFANPKKKDFLLQITHHAQTTPDNAFVEILKKYCSTFKLINIKSIGEENKGTVETSYYINLRDERKNEQFVGELKKISGVSQVNVFFDED